MPLFWAQATCFNLYRNNLKHVLFEPDRICFTDLAALCRYNSPTLKLGLHFNHRIDERSRRESSNRQVKIDSVHKTIVWTIDEALSTPRPSPCNSRISAIAAQRHVRSTVELCRRPHLDEPEARSREELQREVGRCRWS